MDDWGNREEVVVISVYKLIITKHFSRDWWLDGGDHQTQRKPWVYDKQNLSRIREKIQNNQKKVLMDHGGNGITANGSARAENKIEHKIPWVVLPVICKSNISETAWFEKYKGQRD